MTLIKISLSLLFTLKTNQFISNPSLQFASEIITEHSLVEALSRGYHAWRCMGYYWWSCALPEWERQSHSPVSRRYLSL